MLANKFKITGMALLMALSLSACGGGGGGTTPEPTQAPSASVEVTAPETHAPVAEPTAVPQIEKDAVSDEEMGKLINEKRQTVANINLDEAFKAHSDANLEKVFPSKSFDTKAGAEVGLKFMQDLINTENFYMEREAGSDIEILTSEDFAPRMDESMLNEVRKSVKENHFFSWIPAANTKGQLPVGDGKMMTVAAAPSSEFNTPAIIVDEWETGNILFVQGERKMTWTSTEGKSYTNTATYYVGVVPSGDDWTVASLGWKSDSSTLKEVK